MSALLGEHGGPPAPFAVTGPPEIRLDSERRGTTTFTVTNLTGRPVRARVRARGRDGAQDGWLSLPGPGEIPLAVAATATVDVQVAVPPDVPGGQHLLVLEVVPEDDTEAVVGQAARFLVPPPGTAPARPRRRWLRIVLIVLGSLLALIGLLVVVLLVALVVSSS